MLKKELIEKIPSQSGVYLFKYGHEVLYVGKSINLKARIRSHLKSSELDAKEYAIISKSDTIDYVLTDSEFHALLQESYLIQKYKPKYNVRWRDDKSYLYLKITRNEVYPKVLLSRKPIFQDKTLYFGPFSSTHETEAVLKEIRKIYPFCTQKKLGKLPCFYSKIGLCNPCPNFIEKIADRNVKDQLKKQYRQNIKQVIKILYGKFDTILIQLNKDIKELTRIEKYENALVIRNKIRKIEYLMHERQFVTSSDDIYGNNTKKAISDLESIISNYFQINNELKRIECYDVSNLSFKEATASMVVLTEGIPDKSQYKRFKIKSPKFKSDLEMLQEVIIRRIKNPWPLPDLFVVDGGKPQVRIVLASLIKHNIQIPLMGIAKHPDRLIFGINNLPTLRLKNNSKALNLIRIIRDESHRFARKYHLLLRDRNLFYLMV